jgi:transcriptional regulator with XRE-family HTH domain
MAPRKERKKPEKPAEPAADPLSPFLGPLLLRARQAVDMKQEIVAEKVKLSDATLRKIEKGQASVPIPLLESICKVLGVNPDVLVLEASTAMRCDLLGRLGRDPELPLYDLQEKRRVALKARHEAELKELEADLSWDSVLYIKQKKFVNRE